MVIDNITLSILVVVVFLSTTKRIENTDFMTRSRMILWNLKNELLRYRNIQIDFDDIKQQRISLLIYRLSLQHLSTKFNSLKMPITGGTT